MFPVNDGATTSTEMCPSRFEEEICTVHRGLRLRMFSETFQKDDLIIVKEIGLQTSMSPKMAIILLNQVSWMEATRIRAVLHCFKILACRVVTL